MTEIAELQLNTVIGYNGNINNGLVYTSDGKFVIYSLGSTVVIKKLSCSTQAFLHGHTDCITCLALSHDETKLATGQQSKSRGNKAPVILWDLQSAIECMMESKDQSDKCLHHLTLHMGKVQDLCFSAKDQYLYTVGGQDDNSLVCWRVDSGDAVCGTPAGEDSTQTVKAFNLPDHDDLLVTGGNYAFAVWRVDHKSRKFHSLKANLGNLKRIISCVTLSQDDTIAFCGTVTGDLLEIILECDLTKPNCLFPPMGNQKPRYNRTTKERFSMGIKSIALHSNGKNHPSLYIGAGDGTLAQLKVNSITDKETKPIPTVKAEKILGSITSIYEGPPGEFYIGTSHSNMYSMTVEPVLKLLLRGTCHYNPINDIIFPKNPDYPSMSSELFLTCSMNDIRVWNAQKFQEILRIQVPNITCNCIDLTMDGTTIVSGWDDGKIRAFYPESGKLKFVIQDAHTESVTAIAVCNPMQTSNNEWRMVSGGNDGKVRIWKISPARQTMEASMKEHRGPVNSIQILKDNSACVSASSDGSCIVWNLHSYVRTTAMFASTVFRSIMYHPDESQLLTCGSDHRITYYDAYDGEAIRILEEASEGEVLAMDIDSSGTIFATAGRDKTLQVWHYDNGEVMALGKGHSGDIHSLKISPDHRSIVTVGSEGAIMVWNMGETLERAEAIHNNINNE